jgi:hypothetical protein
MTYPGVEGNQTVLRRSSGSSTNRLFSLWSILRTDTTLKRFELAGLQLKLSTFQKTRHTPDYFDKC